MIQLYTHTHAHTQTHMYIYGGGDQSRMNYMLFFYKSDDCNKESESTYWTYSYWLQSWTPVSKGKHSLYLYIYIYIYDKRKKKDNKINCTIPKLYKYRVFRQESEKRCLAGNYLCVD